MAGQSPGTGGGYQAHEGDPRKLCFLRDFSWARLEPEEGEFHFGWIRRIIDKLYENGIYTILATPTGAMPNWMTAKYEEVRQMSPEAYAIFRGEGITSVTPLRL